MKTPTDDIRIQVPGVAATQYTGANFTVQASRRDKVGSIAMDQIVEVAKRIREFLAEWAERAAIDTKGIQVVSKLGVHQNRQTYEPDGYIADYNCTFLCKNIVEGIALQRPMKIVVDSGNGIPGATAPAILRALGCEVVDLYSKVDGDFPNHHPDPSKPENLADLIKVVHATDAELGVAFDGDGDRLGLVTKGGHIIYPDRQLMLLARDVLSRNPGGTVIFDVKCSQRLPVVIREAGGVPMMYKTGHSLIKAKMKELAAPIAGEMSGHIFLGERWYGFDDAMYTCARVLEILSRSADPSAVLDALPTSYSTPELNVACAEGEPHKLVAELQATAKFPGAEVNTIDGLRADYDDGFGLIRASNTTPVLVMRFEGHTPEALHRIEADFMAALRRVKPDAQFAAAAH